MVNKIELTSPSRRYLFRIIAPLRNAKSQPVSAIPFVNQSAQNNALFRFSGQTEEYSFSFAIYDDGSDTSDGTHSSTVITIAQQIDYLKNTIFSQDFDAVWTLTNDRFASSGVGGVVTKIDIDNPPGGATLITGTFSFKLGRIALTT